VINNKKLIMKGFFLKLERDIRNTSDIFQKIRSISESYSDTNELGDIGLLKEVNKKEDRS